MATSLAAVRRGHAETRVRTATGLPAIALAVDVVLIALSLLSAAVARSYVGLFEGTLDNSWPLWAGGSAIFVLWMVSLAATGAYRRASFGVGAEEYKRVSHGSVAAAAGSGITCYLMGWDLARGFFVVAFLVGGPALLLGRVSIRAAVHRARVRGHFVRRALIVGSCGHVDEISNVLRRERWLGYRVVGALVPAVPGGDAQDETPAGTPILGVPQRAVETLVGTGADVLFVASGAFDSAQQVRSLAWELEDLDIEVIVAPSVTDVAAERVRIRPVGGLPLIHLERPATVNASHGFKRTFDVACAGFLLLLFAPLLGVIAATIVMHDRGPVLFRQHRVGRDGQTFTCLKFRTMVVDAEARLAQLHLDQGFEGGLFKMKSDPRVTATGRWLRRYSLDELPQLVNVLRGDMSLVGPRPGLVVEAERYDDLTRRRLRVRPGLTGLWQVSGRSDLSYDEAVRLDLYYVDNWSLLQDLSILRRTFSAVVGSRGAY